MLLYAIVMFAVSVLLTLLSVGIYKGNTSWIHDYHQTNVTNKIAYGKAFGKAMGVLAFFIALSGVTALFGEVAAWRAVVILLVGLTVGIAALVRVQKKYNGGVF